MAAQTAQPGGTSVDLVLVLSSTPLKSGVFGRSSGQSQRFGHMAEPEHSSPGSRTVHWWVPATTRRSRRRGRPSAVPEQRARNYGCTPRSTSHTNANRGSPDWWCIAPMPARLTMIPALPGDGGIRRTRLPTGGLGAAPSGADPCCP